MPPAAKPVIKAQDFEDFEYSLLIKNNTVLNEVHDSSKVRIVELLEKGMVLIVPHGVCGEAQNLTLYLYPGKSKLKVTELPDPKKEKHAMIITCKVNHVATSKKSGKTLVIVEFLQYTETAWKSFCNKFSSAQKQIDKVFKAIKE